MAYRTLAAVVFAALLGIGALTATAGAYTCTTNCNTYGNQTTCQRTCF